MFGSESQWQKKSESPENSIAEQEIINSGGTECSTRAKPLKVVSNVAVVVELYAREVEVQCPLVSTSVHRWLPPRAARPGLRPPASDVRHRCPMNPADM